MTYEAALTKAWKELEGSGLGEGHCVRFMNDTYDMDLKGRRITSRSCNVPTKDYLTILLLHYVLGSMRNKFSPSGEWVSFKEIENGEIYYPAFREGAISLVLKKYGSNPESLLDVLKRFEGTRVKEGDAAVEISTFEEIRVRIIIWKADEEFGPEATMLFDKNMTSVFSMEDIVVFLRFVAHNI
jgi:hypothetical protein